MRLSTSPPIIRNHFIRNTPQYYEVQQNNRSNSLSQLSLHSSKFHTKIDNSNYSPYYHQNSQMRIVSSQQLTLQPKPHSVLYTNTQGPSSLQVTIKKLSQKLQNIEKRLKKQETQTISMKKINQQRQMLQKVHQKINQQMHKKSTNNYELICQEIKRINSHLAEREDIENKKQKSFLQTSINKQYQFSQISESENFYKQKMSVNAIVDDKIKFEISKLENYIDEQLKKNLQQLKRDLENVVSQQDFSLLTKSKLKYRLSPIEISVKNEVSINKNPSQLKSSKKLSSLSTAHSSGSSQENEQVHKKGKTISIEQQTYFIDRQGYLLDENGYYLLNQKQKMIKIDKNIIKKLNQMKMLE